MISHRKNRTDLIINLIRKGFIFILISLLTEVNAETSILEKAKIYYYQKNFSAVVNILKDFEGTDNPEVLYYLGLSYSNQIWTKRDQHLAISYFTKAAKNNYVPAMWALAQAYENGNGVAKNILRAMDWYRMADKAEHNIELDAKFLSSENNQLISQNKAVKLLEEQAATGDPEAQFKLAKTYDLGRLVKHDMAKAIYWYQKASASGHSYAKFLIGYFHCRGVTLDKDIQLANQLFTESGRDIRCTSPEDSQ